MFFGKKLTEFDIYKKVLQYAVLNNGVISSKVLGKIYKDVKLVKSILNELYRENVISLNIVSGGITNYTFHSFPESYRPVEVSTTDELSEIVLDLANEDEDGQVFLSAILFEVELDVNDVLELMTAICDNDQCTMFISPGNIKYYIIKE
ncbi:MAG: hypothetical protein PF574_07940 [Candidatus Delongbacteria bacterium]|jgi:hypothetical protein|nr:hypothetical protein [Candidatus Delongbacteria bacterium]